VAAPTGITLGAISTTPTEAPLVSFADPEWHFTAGISADDHSTRRAPLDHIPRLGLPNRLWYLGRFYLYYNKRGRDGERHL